MVYYVADCETTEWNEHTDKLELILVCLLKIDNNTIIERHSFNKSSSFNQYFIEQFYKNKRKKARIYFHNLKYDRKFISEGDIQQMIVKSSLVLNVKSTYVDMRDSYSLLVAGVDILGKAYGLEKMDMHKDDLETYCYRDCEIVFHYLEELAKMLYTDVEHLKLTLGAEMHSMFHDNNVKYEYKDEKGRRKNRITNYATEPTPDKPYAYNYRNWFHGARCEVYNHNAYEKVYPYDINSMYCYIQTENKFPLPPYYQIPNSTNMDIHTILLDDRVFGCVCEVDEQHFAPFIPERDDNHRLIFRTGLKTAFLFREELKYCILHHYSLTITEIHYCDSWDYIFEYLKPIYEEKMNSQFEYIKQLRKAMLVRSYGKFCELQTSENIILVNEPNIEYEEKLVKEGYKISNGCIEYPLLYSTSVFHHKKINIVIGMRITALAKLLQQKYIDETIEKKGVESLIYTDTDSIFTDSEIFENSKALGKMKLDPIIENFSAISRKFYVSLEDQKRTKIKGINNKLPIEEKLKFISTFGVNIDRPIGFKEAIKNNLDERSVVHTNKKSHEMRANREVFLDGSTLPFNYVPDKKEKIEEWIQPLPKSQHHLGDNIIPWLA